MTRLLICDSSGELTAEIEALGAVLQDALDHEQAGPLLRCAVLMGLSALTEGGDWPLRAIEWMSAFMASMKDEVHHARLM